MIGEVLKLDEFNTKAWLRKLSYLEQAGNLEILRKEIKWIKLQPSCHDHQVRAEAARIEKELNIYTDKDKEIAKNLFKSGSLYKEKPDVAPEAPEPTEWEKEWAEECEYLTTLSNFHWFMYPFFKTLEAACDKVFGCKK